jgi:hypothetical protein
MRSARVFLRASFFSVRTSEEDQGRRFEFLANLQECRKEKTPHCNALADVAASRIDLREISTVCICTIRDLIPNKIFFFPRRALNEGDRSGRPRGMGPY